MRFAYPLVLVLLPVLLGAAYWLFRASRKSAQRRLEKFSSAGRLPNLLRSVNYKAKNRKFVMVAGALVFLIIAMARPLWGPRGNKADQTGTDFFFILDVSKSMLTRDVEPSRLDLVKKTLSDWLKTRTGDRIGLILVAGDAFVQAPLTTDYTAFREVLQRSGPKALSLGGTNIPAAVKLAVKTFEKTDVKNKIVVLISDGENLEGRVIDEVRNANLTNQIQFFTVGVGTAEGGKVPLNDPGPDFKGPLKDLVKDEYGIPVLSRFEERTLRSIATAGGGKYFKLDPEGQVWESLYNQELKQAARKTNTLNVNDYEDLFQIPLACAILLLAIEMAVQSRFRNPPRPTSAVTLPKPSPAPAAMTMKSKKPAAQTKKKPSVKAAAKPAVKAVLLLLCAAAFAPQTSRADVKKTISDAEVLVSQGKPKEAAEMLRAAAQTNPDDYFLMYNYGVAAYAAGNFQEAIDAFSEVSGSGDEKLRANALKQLGNAQYRLGQTLLKNGNRSGAVVALERSVDYYKGSIDERGDRDAKKNLQVAGTQLEKVLLDLGAYLMGEAKKQTNPEQRINTLTRVVEYYEKATQLNPDNPEAMQKAIEARSLLSQALAKQARDLRDKAAKLEPDKEKDKGKMEQQIKQQEQFNAAANASYEKAREVTPEDKALAAEHDQFRKELADNYAKKAEAKVNQALTVPEKKNINDVYKQQKQLGEAMQQIDKALALDEENALAKDLQKKTGEALEKALMETAQAKQEAGEKAAEAGKADQAVGELTQAMQDYQKALQQNPDNAKAEEGLAKTEEKLAEQLTAAGKAEMEKALAGEPKGAEGKKPGTPEGGASGKPEGGTPASPNQAMMQENIGRLEKAAQSFAQAEALSPGMNDAAALQEQANNELAEMRQELDAALAQAGQPGAPGAQGQPGPPGEPQPGAQPGPPAPAPGAPGAAPLLSFSDVRGSTELEGQFKDLSKKVKVRDW